MRLPSRVASSTSQVPDFGACRSWREHENHRVGLANQGAEPSLPSFTAGDVVPVHDAVKAAGIECCVKLVGEPEIIAAVGKEDAKLPSVGRAGSARLLRSHITRFRRGRSRCVMRNVCHGAPPSPELILAQSAWVVLAGIPGSERFSLAK